MRRKVNIKLNHQVFKLLKLLILEKLEEYHEDEDDADVDMTQLNNRRRCFVLQKRELDRIDEKKLYQETDDA